MSLATKWLDTRGAYVGRRLLPKERSSELSETDAENAERLDPSRIKTE